MPVIPPASVVKRGPSAPGTLKAQDKKKERVARGGPSAPVIPATTLTGSGTATTGGGLSAPVIPVTIPIEPGTMTVGGRLSVPRTLPVRRPGNVPETAEIETPTSNAVLPGPQTGTVLARTPAEPATPGNVRTVRGPALSPWGNLQGRLRELGAPVLSGFRPLHIVWVGWKQARGP